MIELDFDRAIYPEEAMMMQSPREAVTRDHHIPLLLQIGRPVVIGDLSLMFTMGKIEKGKGRATHLVVGKRQNMKVTSVLDGLEEQIISGQSGSARDFSTIEAKFTAARPTIYVGDKYCISYGGITRDIKFLRVYLESQEPLGKPLQLEEGANVVNILNSFQAAKLRPTALAGIS